MPVRKRLVLLTMASLSLMPIVAWGQQRPTGAAEAAVTKESAREKILESRRWRRMLRSFEEWMSVQSVHTAEQMAKLKARLDEQNESMTAIELEDFLYDMEERLEVLMSEDAKEARDWLSVLTMEARQRKVDPGGKFSDAFEMTASQLRQELRQFHQRRAQGAAAHRQFDRAREQGVSAALRDQRAQQEQASQASERAVHAALQEQRNAAPRSPYRPRPTPLSNERQRSIYVNPWGGVSFRFGL